MLFVRVTTNLAAFRAEQLGRIITVALIINLGTLGEGSASWILYFSCLLSRPVNFRNANTSKNVVHFWFLSSRYGTRPAKRDFVPSPKVITAVPTH